MALLPGRSVYSTAGPAKARRAGRANRRVAAKGLPGNGKAPAQAHGANRVTACPAGTVGREEPLHTPARAACSMTPQSGSSAGPSAVSPSGVNRAGWRDQRSSDCSQCTRPPVRDQIGFVRSGWFGPGPAAGAHRASPRCQPSQLVLPLPIMELISVTWSAGGAVIDTGLPQSDMCMSTLNAPLFEVLELTDSRTGRLSEVAIHTSMVSLVMPLDFMSDLS